jgi:hypothetical protein
MAIKRELSDSEAETEHEHELDSGSDFEPEPEQEIDIDIKPSTPKKTKTQAKKAPPKTPGSSSKKRPAPASSPISGSSTDSPAKQSNARVAKEAKRTIAESIIKIGSAGIDVDKLSQAVSSLVLMILGLY